MDLRKIAGILAVVAVCSFSLGAIVASAGNGKTWDDPDAAFQSDSERLAAQQKNTEAFWAKYADWLAKEVALNRDIRSYPVAGALATVGDPLPTLGEATRKADLVVNGVVQSVQFRASADAVVTLTVRSTLKGAEQSTVQIVIPNGLMPDSSRSSASIVQVEAMPMLYPSDDVLLFLTADVLKPQTYNVLPWTGTYWNSNGKLRAVIGNPFARQIETASYSEIAAAVSAAASAR